MIGGEKYVGLLPEGMYAGSSPPATALEPLVHGGAPPGVFTLVEFAVEPYGLDTWIARAVWQLAEDFGHALVVDGAVLTMDGEEHEVPFAETRVRPGEFLRMSGPKVAWRPGVLEALRARERRESR